MLIYVCLRILASSRIPRYDLERQTPHFLGGSVIVPPPLLTRLKETSSDDSP
jgi:hypothetical protein